MHFHFFLKVFLQLFCGAWKNYGIVKISFYRKKSVSGGISNTVKKHISGQKLFSQPKKKIILLCHVNMNNRL